MESSGRRISALEHGMINVMVKGIVRRKSILNVGANGEFFFCYLSTMMVIL